MVWLLLMIDCLHFFFLFSLMTIKVHNCPLCLLFVKSDMFVIPTCLGFGKPYTLGLAWFARPKTLVCCLDLNPSARPNNYARPATTRNSLNTNSITDRIILFVIWGHNYRRNFFRPSFCRYILTNTFGWYLLTEWRTKYLELKKRRFANVEVFAGDFTDGITEGFKTAASYDDVTDSPFEMPTESPRDSNWNLCTVTCPVYRQNSRRTHRQNNICPFCRPSLPLFLLLLPYPNSPILQTTSPPKKNLPLLSTTSHISWSFVVTSFVL